MVPTFVILALPKQDGEQRQETLVSLSWLEAYSLEEMRNFAPTGGTREPTHFVLSDSQVCAAAHTLPHKYTQ